MGNQSKLNGNRSWAKEEDVKLLLQINAKGKQNWKSVARESGLKRTANSCRLRWENHLKPRARPGKLTDEEKLLILEFRSQWGGRNCWSKIARHLLPGRTDNDVKNFWHSLANKAKREGCDVDDHAILKRVELMETIEAAGKFTKDYSSSICPVAYNKLKELLPDLRGSPEVRPDAETSDYSVEFGHGAGGRTQVPGEALDSASTESKNQGCYHMQVTSSGSTPVDCNTVGVDAPQFLALEAEFNCEFFDLYLTDFEQAAFSYIY